MTTANNYWHMTGLHLYGDYPIGSMVLGNPEESEGVWKKMDGIENINGSGIDSQTAVYFERVA